MERTARWGGLGWVLCAVAPGCGGSDVVGLPGTDEGQSTGPVFVTGYEAGPDDGFDEGRLDTWSTSDGPHTATDGVGGSTFGGSTFGGSTFGGSTFGHESSGSSTFGGSTFGGSTFGSTTDGGPGTSSDTGPLTCIEVELGSAVGAAVASGSTVGENDTLSQVCAGGDGADVVHHWTAPGTGTWTFDTNGSDYDTALTLYLACDEGAEFACDDDSGDGLASQIEVSLQEGESVMVVVEGFQASEGAYQLNITGDPLVGFESPQPFGDSVQELDLVGTWNLPTDGGAPGYTMSLTIGADGGFVWEETDAVCVPVREGTGQLWVAGAQLVMLFDTFDGVAPWPTADVLGWDVQAPFLIRAGYAPVLGHVAISAPPELRVALPWGSRGYARTLGGATAIDNWVSETELWAVPPGEFAATIVSRDRHTLEIEGDPSALYVFQRWWYDSGIQTADPTIFDAQPYTDDGVGNLVLEGQPYTYVGQRMASFAPGDNFQLGAPTACP